jgi:hypothetical protein
MREVVFSTTSTCTAGSAYTAPAMFMAIQFNSPLRPIRKSFKGHSLHPTGACRLDAPAHETNKRKEIMEVRGTNDAQPPDSDT